MGGLFSSWLLSQEKAPAYIIHNTSSCGHLQKRGNDNKWCSNIWKIHENPPFDECPIQDADFDPVFHVFTTCKHSDLSRHLLSGLWPPDFDLFNQADSDRRSE